MLILASITPSHRVVIGAQRDHFTYRDRLSMHIEFDLNQNDLEALLRHCKSFKPASGDRRDDQRLEDALEDLQEALLAANASR